MLCLQCFLHVGCHAMFAYDSRVATRCGPLEGRVLSSGTVLITSRQRFLPFPYGREVCLALRTLERLGRRRYSRLLCDEVNYVLQTDQIDELRVGGVRYKMHLWRRRLRRRYLQQCLLKLLP